MATKLSYILNTLANKPKSQLSYYGFSEKANKRSIHKTINNHFSNFKINNTLYLLWNNSFPEEIPKSIRKENKITNNKSYEKTIEKSYEKSNEKRQEKVNSLIIEDPFKTNYIVTPTKKLTNEIKKEKTYRTIQECLVATLFPEYEISLNREGFIKEFRNFLALKGNEIFPDYKFISKIIKKLEYGEDLMQSKTLFKIEWLSVISLIFYINIVYFKGYQNYSNMITFLPINRNKRTLIINETENSIGKEIRGEIRGELEEILEKINPNFSKGEVEKMKLEEIQKYSKYLGISIYKEGKVGYINKTKEELINEIFPNEIINEVINEV
jgi:hypothetical protein